MFWFAQMISSGLRYTRCRHCTTMESAADAVSLDSARRTSSAGRGALSIAMTSGQRAASVRGRGRGRGGRGRGRGQPRGRGTGRGRGGSTAVAGATVAAGDITRAAILDVNPGPVRLVPEGAAGEGLYVYIQTQTCRRALLGVVINRLVCCDICNPELLKRSQLGPIARKKKRARVRKCEVNLDIVQELCKWRMRMKKKYFAGTLYAPHALLPTEICETLAAMGPIDDKRQLATALQDGWSLPSLPRSGAARNAAPTMLQTSLRTP